MFHISPQLDILCTSAVRRYSENNTLPFTRHLFWCYQSSLKQTNTE